jgi:hypothetical protein
MEVPALPEPPKLSKFLVTAVITAFTLLASQVLIPLLMERPDDAPKPTRLQQIYEASPWLFHTAVAAIVSGGVLWWAWREAKRFYAQAVEHSNSTTAAIASAVEAHMEAAREVQAIKDRFEATQEVQTYRALESPRLVRLGDPSVPPIRFLRVLAPDIGQGFPPEHLIANLAFYANLSNAVARISFHENVGICVSHGVLLPVTQNLSPTIQIPLVQRYEVTPLGSRVLAVRPDGG